MKTLKYLTLFFIASLLSTCDDKPKYLTVINPDGSCYKLIEAWADSSFMVGDTLKSNPFGVALDSTWKISWSYITPEFKTDWPLKNWTWDTAHKETGVKVRALKRYNSVEEMAKTFRFHKDHEWRSIQPKYDFDRKFRWFYTYYSYSELYPKIKTFDKIPLEKYLSKTEAEFWFNGNSEFIRGMNGIEIKDEADRIEENFNKWFEHNIWEEEMNVLLKNYELLKDPPVTKNELISVKDSFFLQFHNKQKEKDQERDFSKFLDGQYKTKAFSELYNREGNPLKAYEDSLDDSFMDYYERSIDYNLIMPGKILQAENALNHGDTLKFNLDAYRMTYNDYEIKATSRKTNTWAFWVTGIIVVVAVGSMFVKKR